MHGTLQKVLDEIWFFVERNQLDTFDDYQDVIAHIAGFYMSYFEINPKMMDEILERHPKIVNKMRKKLEKIDLHQLT